MPADRHGWNDLEHYIGIHESCLRDFEHVIESNGLTFEITGPDTLTIAGRIDCQGDLFLDVRKTLQINTRNQVRTIRYSYHAGIDAPRRRSLFRYDNAHTYKRAGHPDAHHKHVFNEDGTESRDPEWIGYERWPTLREVLSELEEWWWETGQVLES